VCGVSHSDAAKEILDMGLRIKKGDQVLVLAGKDKGKKGKVIQTMPKDNAVIVDGVNVVTRHQKPRQTNRATPTAQTGRIQKPAPLCAAKVMVICPRCDKPSRLGSGVGEGGRHARVCKRCGELVDVT
jgi:large subunit ribosomal protein L24